MNQQENREIRISPDALIALVVAEAEDRELSAMPSLEEMNAAFHPSEEFQKKMDRLLKQAKRKQERKGAWRATKRLFVVATTVVTAFACILMPVQAVQEAVVSTVLNWRDQFVEILYSKEDDPNAVILLQNVELTYLPESPLNPILSDIISSVSDEQSVPQPSSLRILSIVGFGVAFTAKYSLNPLFHENAL